MRKMAIVIAVIVVLLIACCGLYFGGNIGIVEDRIISEQMKTVSWDEQEYNVLGTSDGDSLYVGVMYMKDYSDAKYFIYIKKGGLSFGWHFLQSGGLTELDGIRAFDCGQYGIAYVSINESGTVQKIEFTDGSNPSTTENVGKIICEESKSTINFYDANGEIIRCNRITVLD